MLIAGSREPAVSCGAGRQCWNGAALSRALLPGALGLTRGQHSPVPGRSFLVSTNTSGVLLILESSSSPMPLLMPTTHALFQTMQTNLLSQVTTLEILPLHSPSRQMSRNYLSLHYGPTGLSSIWQKLKYPNIKFGAPLISCEETASIFPLWQQ